MTDIINFISPYIYIFLVVSSVVFGISLAVNLWVYSTIKKVKTESDKNFNYYMSSSEMRDVFLAINSAKLDYYKVIENNKKSKKNKGEKSLNLEEKVDENLPKTSEVFTNLIKDVYKPFSVVNGKERGYLSFTKNEVFEVSRIVIGRLDELLSNSGVGFIKNIKISYLASGISLYVGYKNFLEKLWVTIIFKTINFFMWFFKVLSPVSISKYLIKNFTSQNVSLLISDTIVEVTAKELAVIYKKERIKLEKEDLSNKKAV